MTRWDPRVNVHERRVAFTLVHAPRPRNEGTVRFIFERMVTRPDGVLELADGDVRSLVALIEGALSDHRDARQRSPEGR